MQASILADLLLTLDAFTTAWQFPVWEVDFGEGLAHFFGSIHPMPPYHSCIMPAPPATGGFYL